MKDADEDARFRPYRPVPRGLVTLRELFAIGIAAAVIQLALALWLDAALVWLLVVPWSWLLLMSREFFVPRWLRAHPIFYMTSHMVVLPLIDLYATACDWRIAGETSAPVGLTWFLIVSYLNGIVVEIGRKTRAPIDEEHGVETYSALWGARRAAQAWLLAVFMTAAAAWTASARIGTEHPALLMLGVLVITCGVVALRFAKDGRSGAGKSIEVMAGVWTLLMYIGFGSGSVGGDALVGRAMTPWILDQAAAATSEHVGGKARALARAAAAGLPVPRFIVVSSAACVDGQKGTSLELEPGVGVAIDAALTTLCPEGVPIAVRSSAADEDGVHHSFAGQLDSFLDVPCHDVRARVVDVWRSAFGDRALVYRRERGLTGQVCPPAVILQRMIAPRASGVAFSADPVSGRRSVAVVSAVRGAGSALVSGEADAETWHVTRDGAIVSVAKRAGESVLSDQDIRNVAALARAAARVFQCPQDIEWAIGGGLVLLQSRPITSLASRPDPDGHLAIWDNSNIVESYSGVTTPLTFSFAREIYPARLPAVLPDDGRARVTRLPRKTTCSRTCSGWSAAVSTTTCSIGIACLALLPGYRLNRRFMEQMMGVSEPLADAVADRIATEVTGSRLRDLLYLPRTAVGLLASYVTLNRRVEAFYRRLDEALRPPSPPLDQRTADELVVHYRELRSRLLLAWDAPLANDFFAMIAYGMLGRLLERWCGKDAVALRNDLIVGNGGMVSAEPVGLLQEMARSSSADSRLIEIPDDR